MRSKQSFNNGRDGGRTSRRRGRGTPPMAEREESSSRRRGRGSPMAEHEESARQERREEENSQVMNVCEHCVALFQNNMILPSPSFQVLSDLPTPIYNNHRGFNIQVFPPPRNNPQDFNIQVPSNLPPPRNDSQSFNVQVRSNLPPPMNNSQGFNIQVLSNLPPPTNNPHGFNGNRPSYSQAVLNSHVKNVQPSQVSNLQPSQGGYVQLSQLRNAQPGQMSNVQPNQMSNVQPSQLRNLQPSQVTQGRMGSQQPSESNRQLPVPFYDFLGVENGVEDWEELADSLERREERK
ncbi:hypothetical protein V8G54_036027 [Vigna mungo]|uniref:Uncharacterized protein n=1 Tax=Vigna mungo TaxID=3915 RepID=A0AAQ3RC19_VIGMU